MPTHNIDFLKWSYKSIGPFTSPTNTKLELCEKCSEKNKVYRSNGLFTPLLTYNFFNSLKDHKLTPVFNVEAQKENINIEFDLGLFFHENCIDFYKGKNLLLFCECKTFNVFRETDVNRMKILSQEFPECILVFSTLKQKLDINEKELIQKLVKEQWDLRNKNKPYSSILILTENELLSGEDINFRHKWKNLSEKHKKFAEDFHATKNIFNLSDTTQELYLDIENYYDWRRKIYEIKVREKAYYLWLNNPNKYKNPDDYWHEAQQLLKKR